MTNTENSNTTLSVSATKIVNYTLYFQSEKEKLGPLAADQQAVKNEIDMLKSSNNKANPKPQTPEMSRKVQVIKNGHTNAELAESGDRWANHKGSYLTLDEVMAIEAAKCSSNR